MSLPPLCSPCLVRQVLWEMLQKDTIRLKNELIAQKHILSILPSSNAFLKHRHVNDTKKRKENQLILAYVFSKLHFLCLLLLFSVKKDPAGV